MIEFIEKTEVLAEEIEQGECFRKRTGKYIYIRISESSVQYLIGKDPNIPLDDIYGICILNGNICKISKKTLVFREKNQMDT